MRNAKPSSEKAPEIIPLSMRRDAGTKTRSKINVRVIITMLDLEDRIAQFLIAIAYWSLSGFYGRQSRASQAPWPRILV
jgi:hypothetical protein